jgi:hypothetical protein
MSSEEGRIRMTENLAQATCRLECATRALNTYLGLRTAATSADPEYQRLWQTRVAAEQSYRSTLVALLARRGELPAGLATDSVVTSTP